MGTLDGRAVIITGAGRGLGRAYALCVAAEGGSVIVNDVDAEPAQEVVAEILMTGGQAEAVVGSVADYEFTEHLVQRCISSFGSIDGLINNAALMHLSGPLEVTEETFRRLVEVNILGSAFLGTHAAREMAVRGGGRIVNVTSTAHLGRAGTSAYAITKGAVTSMTYAWAVDLQEHGILVNAIAPSAWTRLTDDFPVPGIDYANLPMPADVAPLAAYLVSDEVDFTGQVLRLEKRALRVMSLPNFPAKADERDSWTVQDVGQVLRYRLGATQRT
jgi:NAD(P)-dependent dehydrogenase (short-subunit alcohol dehydrogenase family)